MKTIYVQTEKIVGYQDDGMPNFQKITQKLKEDVFKEFCDIYLSHGYRNAKVEAVYSKVKGKEGKFLPEEDCKPFIKMLEDAKVSKVELSPEEKLKQLQDTNKMLMERLEALEADKEKKPQRGRPKSQEEG